MPEFSWEAVDPRGARSRGRLVASSEAEALQDLERQGLLPLRVRAALEGRVAGGKASGGAAVQDAGFRLPSPRNRAGVLEFTRGVAALLPAGMPLSRALAVAAGSTTARLRDAFQGVRDRVERGEELATALQAEPALFSPLYVGMVRAGERSGTLDRAFERLAAHLEAEAELRSRLVSMSIYPALLALTGFASVLVLVLFVLPRFADLLTGSGAPLPGVTAFVLGVSEGARAHAPLLGLGAGLLVVAFLWMRGTGAGRVAGARLLLALPVVGGWRRQVLAARFARMCGELVAGGAPVLPALDDTRGCLADPVAREAVGRVRTRVREGSTLHRALAQEGLFPRELEQLVALGEEAGRLADFLLKAAELLERRTARSVERMVALAEPAVIVGFGGIIAVVALSLLQAIYGINAGGL